MALRRLLSGWLIAVAALARSMAQILERAAADRSEPRSNAVADTVMAALAERYPGAPDHWLALVAERTSQLAEAGEAPLSLSSQPSVWPSSLPGAAGPLEPLTPTALAGGETAPRAPPRPIACAESRRDAVPSLAALQDRASEVWRRPQAMPHRPRPVFAPTEPTPPRGGPSSRSDAPAGRRPRSPLTLEARSPSPAESLSESVAHAKARSEMTPAGVERTAEYDFASSFTTPPRSERAVEPEAAGRSGPGEHEAAPTTAPSVSRSLLSKTPATVSPIRDAPTVKPSVNTPAPSAARPIVLDAATVERPNFTPLLARPVVRRSIFRTLAWLGRKSRPASLHHDRASAKSAPSKIVMTADHDARSPTLRAHVSQSRPQRSSLAATATPADALETIAPPTSPEPRAATPAPRAPSPTWTPSFVAGAFANDEAQRADFAISRSSTSTPAPRIARSSIDDRWPKFPPSVFAPLVVAEIPPSRLEQLAREQEEGRWSV